MCDKSKIIIFISAYDAGLHTSEGYIIRQFLARIPKTFHIILLTRRNNVEALRASNEVAKFQCSVSLLAYELPKSISWWKKGPRGYSLYSYLWQLTWPLVIYRRRNFLKKVAFFHVFNFHNDSIPHLAWILSKKTIWGPVNHNEQMESWRFNGMARKTRYKHLIRSQIRKLQWRFDPFLAASVKKSGLILSSGHWVDHRLRLCKRQNYKRLSQLGSLVTSGVATQNKTRRPLRLITAGRLDLIKGNDLALDALALLPREISLTIVGDGYLKSKLQKQVHELHLNERVHFVSSVDHDNLMSMFREHDLFLFPSAEAGGLVWVEALMNGLPVLGIERPSELTSQAGKLTGVYVSSGEGDRHQVVTSFAKKILEISKTTHNRSEISTLSGRKYSWEHFTHQILSAYENFEK